MKKQRLKLFGFQKQMARDIVNELKTGKGKLIHIPCGLGKSMITKHVLYLLRRDKK